MIMIILNDKKNQAKIERILCNLIFHVNLNNQPSDQIKYLPEKFGKPYRGVRVS